MSTQVRDSAKAAEVAVVKVAAAKAAAIVAVKAAKGRYQWGVQPANRFAAKAVKEGKTTRHLLALAARLETESRRSLPAFLLKQAD